MMWKRNIPTLGDTRIIKRFALFPVNLTDGNTIWLETYYIEQIYSIKFDMFSPYNGWKDFLKKKYKDGI